MKSILIVLLFSTAFASKNDPTPSPDQTNGADLVMKFFKNLKVIQEPSHPIFFQGIAFYWYGFYTPSAERPQSCVIMASHPEWPFNGVVFRNGTIPTSAIYGCHSGELCSGARCVKPLTHFNVVTYTLIGIIFLMLVFIFSGEQKLRNHSQRQPLVRPSRPSPRESIINDIFSPSDHRVRFVVPPRYTP